MAAYAVTGDQYRAVHRKMREIDRELDQKEGSPIDPEVLALRLQRIIDTQGNLLGLTRRELRTLYVRQIAWMESWGTQLRLRPGTLKTAVGEESWSGVPDGCPLALPVLTYQDPSGPTLTLRSYLEILAERYTRLHLGFRPEEVSLVALTSYHPGLCWETLIFVEEVPRPHEGDAFPGWTFPPTKLCPHVRVLAALCYFPEIFMRMGVDLPFDRVYLPGLWATRERDGKSGPIFAQWHPGISELQLFIDPLPERQDRATCIPRLWDSNQRYERPPGT